jgi:hypothetical protein
VSPSASSKKLSLSNSQGLQKNCQLQLQSPNDLKTPYVMSVPTTSCSIYLLQDFQTVTCTIFMDRKSSNSSFEVITSCVEVSTQHF